VLPGPGLTGLGVGSGSPKIVGTTHPSHHPVKPLDEAQTDHGGALTSGVEMSDTGDTVPPVD